MTAWGDAGIVDPNFRSHGMYLLRRDKQKKSKQHWREKYGLAMPDASRAVAKVPTINAGKTAHKIQMRALYQNNTTVTIYEETDKKASRSTNRSFRPGQMIIKDRKVKMLRTNKIKNVEKKTNKNKGYLLVDGTTVLEKQRGRTWVFWDKYAKEDAMDVLADKGITAETLKMEEIEEKLQSLPFTSGMTVEVRQPDGSKKVGTIAHVHITDEFWGKFNCQYEDGGYGALIDNSNIVIDRAWSSQHNYDFMMDGNDADRAQREFEAKVINLYQKKTEDPAIKKAMEEEAKKRSLIVIEEEHEDEEQDVEYGTMRVRKKLREMREQYMEDAPDSLAVPEEIREKEKKPMQFSSGDLNELNLLKKGQYIHRGAKPLAPKTSKYTWTPASCKIPPKCRDADDCKNPECLFRHPDGREKIVRKMLEAAHKAAMEKINDPFGLKRRANELEAVKAIEDNRNSAQIDSGAGARYLQLLKQASGVKAIAAPKQKNTKKTLLPSQLMNICWLFRTTGTCKFGVNCPWKHYIPPGMRPAPPSDLTWMQYDQKSHAW